MCIGIYISWRVCKQYHPYAFVSYKLTSGYLEKLPGKEKTERWARADELRTVHPSWLVALIGIKYKHQQSFTENRKNPTVSVGEISFSDFRRKKWIILNSDSLFCYPFFIPWFSSFNDKMGNKEKKPQQ